MNIEWHCTAFDDLLPKELYAILKLRSEVFVVEQQCIFLEMDNKDQYALHLMAWADDTLVGYTRLFSSGISYREVSIGRVVTSPAARGIGLGRILMQRSIDTCISLHGRQSIRIGAQYHLKRFYESFGFQQAGEVYDEDGIDHIEMVLGI